MYLFIKAEEVNDSRTLFVVATIESMDFRWVDDAIREVPNNKRENRLAREQFIGAEVGTAKFIRVAP